MTQPSEPKTKPIRCNNCGHDNLATATACLVCDAPLTFTSRFQRGQHVPTGVLPEDEQANLHEEHTPDGQPTSPRKTGIKCADCGHMNRVGDLFCIECGANIRSVPIQEASSDSTQEIHEFSPSQRRSQDGDRDATVIASQESLTIAKPEIKSVEGNIIPNGCFQFTNNMRLRFTDIESGHYTEVAPKRDKPLLIGRSHQSLPIQPEIDLTPFLMEKHGVSRRHALLRLHDLRLEIQDLNSTNGTGLNGFRFQAKETHQIRNGDILTLGRVSMKVTFIRKESAHGKNVTDLLIE